MPRTPKDNAAANAKKRKNDAMKKKRVYESKKKAKRATLSHMQDIDRRIDERVEKHWKKALKDPLYKRAFANEKVYDADLDGYQYIGRMDVKCERGCGAVHYPNEKTRYICCNGTGHGSFETLQIVPQW